MKKLKEFLLTGVVLALVVSTGGAGSFAASPNTAFAGTKRPERPLKTGNDFLAATFEGESLNIPYRYKQFNAGAGEPVLFVFLHGNSASGTDNQKQVERTPALDAASYIEKHGVSAFVLAPQCPENTPWRAISADLKSLCETFAREHGCAHIYIAGASKGGSGIWAMASQYPDFAEKAVAIASSPSDVNLENLLKTALYAVIGSNDVVSNPDAKDNALRSTKSDDEIASQKVKRNADIVAELQYNGGNAHIKILEGYDHKKTCKEGLSEDILDWLFAK